MAVSKQGRVTSLVDHLKMTLFTAGPIVCARATGVEYAGTKATRYNSYGTTST